jgi:uncharacterized protein (DUF305 family)
LQGPPGALILGVAALVLTAGCGRTSHTGDMGASHPGPVATPQASGAAFNDVDIAFAQNMIPHHRQAVEMADLAASRASDREVKQLAEQVKAAQDPEIKTLTGFLAAWGQPVEPPQGHGAHAMPGMMSDAEMAKLKAANGAGFDRMFAQMMIAHHNGAIRMAQDQRAHGANPQAKTLAATVERVQADEVKRLEAILDRL